MNQDIGTEKKEDKHIILNRAVNHLESLIEQTENLLEDITYDGRDVEQSDEDAKADRPPNLEEVLTSAPGRINDAVEEISIRLSKIKDAIF